MKFRIKESYNKEYKKLIVLDIDGIINEDVFKDILVDTILSEADISLLSENKKDNNVELLYSIMKEYELNKSDINKLDIINESPEIFIDRQIRHYGYDDIEFYDNGDKSNLIERINNIYNGINIITHIID